MKARHPLYGIGSEFLVKIGADIYKITSVILNHHTMYDHVMFRTYDEEGILNSSFFNFFFFNNGEIKGVALPVSFFHPLTTVTFAGLWNDNGINVSGSHGENITIDPIACSLT